MVDAKAAEAGGDGAADVAKDTCSVVCSMMVKDVEQVRNGRREGAHSCRARRRRDGGASHRSRARPRVRLARRLISSAL